MAIRLSGAAPDKIHPSTSMANPRPGCPYEPVDKPRLRPKWRGSQRGPDFPSLDGWRRLAGPGKVFTTDGGRFDFPIGLRPAFPPDSCGSAASYATPEEMAAILEAKTGVPVVLGTHDDD
jgi:predicted metal-binding protein